MPYVNSLSREGVCTIFVDYRISIDEAVKRGKYDWVLGVITDECFPATHDKRANISIELIHFNRLVSTSDALLELDRISMRAINLHELLALGEQFPDLQREFPIVALGSSWEEPKGINNIPYLYGSIGERRLNLYSASSNWSKSWRFATVCK